MENTNPPFYKETNVLGLEKQEIHVVKANPSKPEPETVPDLPFAGLGLRLFAVLIDWFIITIPFIVEALVFNGDYPFLRAFISILVVNAFYFSITVSSKMQASCGQFIVGIKVVNAHGESLSFLNAFLRYLASFFSILPLGLGFWVIAQDKHKQAWHDMLMGTYVVKGRVN